MTPTLSDSFRGCVEQAYGKENVVVSKTGRPGQPIKRWLKDWRPPAGMKDPKPDENGDLYEVLISEAKRSLKGQRPATLTFIWMQGEGDAVNGWASVYEASFMKLLSNIKADLEMRDINFVVGRINEHWLVKPDGEAIRKLQVKLGEMNANSDWINTDDLNRGVNPWGGFSFEDGHFPLQGYTVMGQRFAKAACQLLGSNRGLNPDIFEEHFIDSHEQIQKHDAIGITVGGDYKNLEVLTDGKFGGRTHRDNGWIGLPSSKGPIELTIDLAEPLEIEEIGVNMLLSSDAKAEFPAKVTISTSEDGSTFKVNGRLYNNMHFYDKKLLARMRSEGIEPQSVLLLTRQLNRGKPVTARKLKVMIESGGQWVYIDEVVVNPVPKS